MITLYDHRGRPIDRTALPRELAAPSLTGIRNAWTSESMAAGLTPDRLARILREAADGDPRDYLILAEEMEERDLHYASVLSTRKRAVAGIEPTVIPGGESARDAEIAEAVRNLVEAPEFPALVTDLLDGLGKGYSVVEILWGQTAARWTPLTYQWRDPRFFTFDRATGCEVRLLDEGATYEGLPLAPYKFLVHVPHLKSGLPVRGGLARLAAVSWMCKAYTLADWMSFAEVFGMPLRLGRYGAEATERDIDILKTAVANIGMDAAAVLPDTMRIEFQEAAKSAGGQELFYRLAEYLDRQISKGVLGQTMTTDDGSSQAQATIHNDVRLDIKNDDGRQVAATINRDLIKPFIDLNWGVQQTYPRIKIHEEEPEDTTALAEVLTQVVPLGVRIEAKEARERLGFSAPAEDAELLGQTTPAPTSAPEPTNPPTRRAANRTQSPLDADAILDELGAEALADWEPLAAPVINPVQALADRCADYDAFLAGIGTLAEEMGTAELVASLADATYKARGLGDAED